MFGSTRLVMLGVLVLASAGTALAQPTSAVMQFGNTGTGSGFFPPGQHDQSLHAADKMVPRTAVISVGGTVTFLLSNPVHGAAVYAAGTEPSDINLGVVELLANCPPAPYLNDANGRLAQFAPICAGETQRTNFSSMRRDDTSSSALSSRISRPRICGVGSSCNRGKVLAAFVAAGDARRRPPSTKQGGAARR